MLYFDFKLEYNGFWGNKRSLNNEVRRYMFMKSSSKRVTSSKVATTASKILRDDRYGKATKSVAASALSQAKSKKK